jgi:hypothetical protein
VLIAHREHASVDAPLPTLNGQRALGARAAADAPTPPKTDGGRPKRNTRANDKRKRKAGDD